jgi:hypothetical protein
MSFRPAEHPEGIMTGRNPRSGTFDGLVVGKLEIRPEYLPNYVPVIVTQQGFLDLRY